VIHVKSNHTVVIGAGPYGLSVAAHLHAAGVPVQVLGQPLEFWKGMPQGMYLKSPWTASSLSDPQGRGSLDRYRETLAEPLKEPIPLPYFLKYGRWFADHEVPPIDPTYVRGLTRDGDAYTLELADGRIIRAGRVVVAVGISNFAHTPDFARDLPARFASHTQACHDLSTFKGRRVGVIGTGQSALEWAAMLHEGGADVELIVRGPVHWVSRKLYSGPAKRIFYPPTDVGPPGINWIIAFPLLLRWFPYRYRRSMHVRAVRPAGAKWLRPRVRGWHEPRARSPHPRHGIPAKPRQDPLSPPFGAPGHHGSQQPPRAEPVVRILAPRPAFRRRSRGLQLRSALQFRGGCQGRGPPGGQPRPSRGLRRPHQDFVVGSIGPARGGGAGE
jgi:hypothetical protein